MCICVCGETLEKQEMQAGRHKHRLHSVDYLTGGLNNVIKARRGWLAVSLVRDVAT